MLSFWRQGDQAPWRRWFSVEKKPGYGKKDTSILSGAKGWGKEKAAQPNESLKAVPHPELFNL
jgi:hypothetical protein